jgi:uncharacterized membrane protein YgdD (TMEM256/DUF423 family)
MRIWLILAGLMGAEAVIAGAMSAHMDLPPHAKELIDKAMTYEMWHALALVNVAILSKQQTRPIQFAGFFFLLGTILFCGTLYMQGFWDMKLFPMSAPIGGSCFILGWLCLAWAGFKRVPQQQAK